MRITLLIDDKEKTFVNDHVTLLHYRKAIELKNHIANSEQLDELDLIDRLTDFVVRVFNHQFTVDEVMNGLKAKETSDTLWGVYRKVVALGEGREEEEDEGNEAGKQSTLTTS